MTEIITIDKNDRGNESVNARDLHTFIESKRDFPTWINDRIKKYGFEAEKDFTTIRGKSSGGRLPLEYHISIDMAKELSMVENNEKGKEARKYFIEVEKRARQISTPQLSDDEMIRNAMTILDSRVKKLESKIEQDKDKVQFFHDVTGSKDAIEMSKVAKIIDCGMGRNKLFEFLRAKGVLRGNNEPMQRYIDMKWFRVVEQKYETAPGDFRINIKTLVHQKGIDGIIKLVRSER